MKTKLILLALIAAFYLIMSFLTMDFNVVKWHWFPKLTLILGEGFLIFALFASSITRKQNETKR